MRGKKIAVKPWDQILSHALPMGPVKKNSAPLRAKKIAKIQKSRTLTAEGDLFFFLAPRCPSTPHTNFPCPPPLSGSTTNRYPDEPVPLVPPGFSHSINCKERGGRGFLFHTHRKGIPPKVHLVVYIVNRLIEHYVPHSFFPPRPLCPTLRLGRWTNYPLLRLNLKSPKLNKLWRGLLELFRFFTSMLLWNINWKVSMNSALIHFIYIGLE